jgi:SAM-dependent methyltransferase
MSEDRFSRIREFYDTEYYAAEAGGGPLPWHTRQVAARLGDLRGKAVLDVACGRGEWLQLLQQRGAARVAGIDLSQRAIETCRARMPQGEFHCGPAETLPFADAGFDLVTCMGSLEHFLDKPGALREMVRVSRPGARFLILVPNAGFLTRRLGLYGGTHQVKVQEDVLSLAQWSSLFEGAGLKVEARWRDLHPLSRGWIGQGRNAAQLLLRTAQALALAAWPVAWQYQVYHWCTAPRR